MSTTAKQETAISQNMPTMSSLELSEVSGRRHTDIIRSINRMNEDLIAIGKTPAALCKYKGANNKMLPMYHLTKYQCELLAMALSGEARIRVLDRLYEMEGKGQEQKLLPIDISSIDIYNPQQVSWVMWSMADLARNMSEKLLESQSRIQQIENMSVEDMLKLSLAKMNQPTLPDPERTHTTAKGYLSGKKIRKGNSYILKFSKLAKRLCLESGLPVEKIEDTRYGYLNIYPRNILEKAYGMMA